MNERLRLDAIGGMLMMAGILVGAGLDWLTGSHDAIAGWLPTMLGLALLLPTRVERA